MPRLQGRSQARSALKWIAIALGSLVAVALVLALLLDSNLMRGPLERFAAARLGRTVAIDGDLDIDPWSLTPQLTASGLTIGNAAWDEERPAMATVERLVVQVKLLSLLKGDVILPQVTVETPDVYMHRNASEHANWVFGDEGAREPAGPDQDAPELPVVQNLLVRSGRLEIVDEVRKLIFRGTLEAREGGEESDPESFRLKGEGELNGRRFEARVAGGSLKSLDAGEPYPFELRMLAGDIQVLAHGVVPKPFDLSALTTTFEASGKDLADLYYLTGMPFPNTRPYQVAATVEREGAQLRVGDIRGTVGESDVRGKIDVDLSGERPKVTGEIASELLGIEDLAAPLGVDVGTFHGVPPADAATQPPAGANAPDAVAAESDAGEVGSLLLAEADDGPYAPVFPDAQLQVKRVRSIDADVRYTAQAVNAGPVPLKDVSIHVQLADGVLDVRPFSMELPQGRLSGIARLDARADVPQTTLDMRIEELQLDQLKGTAPDAAPPLGGMLYAHAVLEGSGTSVHEFVSNANGTVTAVVPDGEIRAAFAELIGINVLRGLGLLLTDDMQHAELRCGVANFDVSDGTMRAEHVVFDTADVLITGGGEVRLGQEELDLSLKGDPKELRMVRLDAPVEINGHLRHPVVGVDVGDTARQAGIAAVLGAVVAPLAALIAFVDTGLAEDANCAALLAEAGSQELQMESESPLSDVSD